MSNDNLPPLAEPKYYAHQFGEACGYTADQVRAAIRADRAARSNQLNAYASLVKAKDGQIAHLNAEAAKHSEAVNTLASEREANALLTAEIESLRAASRNAGVVPPEWISEIVGGGTADLSYGHGYRKGFNDCRAKVIAATVAPDLGARDAALEEAAALAVQWGNARVDDGGGNALRNCAEAIRALKGQPAAAVVAPAGAGMARIDLEHGAYLIPETKTTGAPGWLMYHEFGLVRALNAFETLLVESVLAKSKGQA